MNIEDRLRNRVATTWRALQSAKAGSKQELDAFRQYCEALDEASKHAAEQVTLATNGQGGKPMKVALRVLAAINQRQTPSASDVAILRESVPNGRHLPPDELACEVIQQDMRRRIQTRAAGES
jgi:hypothetical protein